MDGGLKAALKLGTFLGRNSHPPTTLDSLDGTFTFRPSDLVIDGFISDLARDMKSEDPSFCSRAEEVLQEEAEEIAKSYNGHFYLSRIFPKTLALLAKWQRGAKMKR